MDELNFRRKLYADPSDNSEEIVEACKNDKNKAQLKADLLEFDDKLAQAFYIDVPENLSERILLNQGINTQHSIKKKRKSHFAIAASLVAACGLTLGVLQYSPQFRAASEHGVVGHAIAHLTSELDHIPHDGEATLDQLNSKLAYFGGQLIEQFAQIKFVSFCTFEGTRSLHVVMNDNGTDVTVFIIPKSAQLTAQETTSQNGYVGTMIDSINANLVVVSNDKNTNYNWSQKLTSSLKWQKV